MDCLEILVVTIIVFHSLMQFCWVYAELVEFFSHVFSKFDRMGTDYIDAMPELLEALHSVGETHKMLHALKLRSFKGSRPEMHFIKGLLACISTLEKVVIIHDKTFKSNEEFNQIQEILGFSHASTKAEILFV